MLPKDTLESKAQGGDGSASRFLNKRGVAEYIGISIYTIDAWVSQGRIPHFKLGRRVLFKSRDIDKWMDEHKVEPLSEEKNLDF